MKDEYIRDRNILVCVEKNDGKRYDSINKAKKKSRKLQKSGHKISVAK